MFDVHKDISLLIERQFPDFYREEGQDFIYFVKKYYEFLEQADTGILFDTRRLPEYGDIDKTREEFLKYFVNKYMNGIPLSMLADKRFIEKNILDLYRSKGSIEGIRLLFRLLYNEEIQMYIPQYDVLRPSDGKWMKDYYVEVEYRNSNYLYQGQQITGSISGAKALVETVETRTINNRPVTILFLSNIWGSFTKHDLLFTESIPKQNSTKVIGSVIELEVINGGKEFELGDVFLTPNGSGTLLKSSVIDVKKARGIVEFTLISGGTNYSPNAIITITDVTNTTGTGASIVINGFSNTYTYTYDNVSIIAPYANIPLNSIPFGGPYASMAPKDINSIIASAFNINSITVGSISSIRVTNPGINYNGNISVTVTDPITGSTDAVIEGRVSFEDGVVSKLRILDTGFGYKDGEILTLVSQKDPTKTITVKTKIDGSGFSEGYWRNTDSFLDSDKYIHDSYYYQEYSYEIRSSRSFDKYIDVLRRISHPAGNLPFGRSVLTTNDEEPLYLIYEDIRQYDSNGVRINILEVLTIVNPTTNIFTLTDVPYDNAHLIITINGVTQNIDQYSINGSTVTLNATLNSTDVIEVRHIEYNPVVIKANVFQGDGTNKVFNINYKLPVEKHVYVSINGVIQHIDEYTIFGPSTLILKDPPKSTDIIMIRTYGTISTALQDLITVYSFIGDGVTTVYTHNVTFTNIDQENSIFITINGILQHVTEYSINNNQIILSTPPAVGDKIEIRIPI